MNGTLINHGAFIYNAAVDPVHIILRSKRGDRYSITAINNSNYGSSRSSYSSKLFLRADLLPRLSDYFPRKSLHLVDLQPILKSSPLRTI